MKKKLEEYKAKKALEKKRKTTVIFDPREWKACFGYNLRFLDTQFVDDDLDNF